MNIRKKYRISFYIIFLSCIFLFFYLYYHSEPSKIKNQRELNEFISFRSLPIDQNYTLNKEYYNDENCEENIHTIELHKCQQPNIGETLYYSCPLSYRFNYVDEINIHSSQINRYEIDKCYDGIKIKLNFNHKTSCRSFKDEMVIAFTLFFSMVGMASGYAFTEVKRVVVSNGERNGETHNLKDLIEHFVHSIPFIVRGENENKNEEGEIV